MAPQRRGHQRQQRADLIDIANDAELQANEQHVWSTVNEQRPANTRQAYGPKQEEFKVRCRHGPGAPDAVAPESLTLTRVRSYSASGSGIRTATP
jgi:hypothetical protein